MRHSKLLTIRLTAGILALLAATAAARADDATEPTVIRDLGNGTILVADRGDPSGKPRRYAHRPGLVANGCLSLDERHIGKIEQGMGLRNECDYTVAVSYCFDLADGERSCDRVGQRQIDVQRIAPRGRLPLGEGGVANAEVRWVACRQTESGLVSLTNRGSRGECLGEETNSGEALRTAATDAK